MANLLWALLTVMVITFPVALVGLFGVMFRWAIGKDPEIFSVFFSTIRRTWKKAYLAAVLDILVGGLVLFNFRIFTLMDASDLLVYVSRGATFSIALLLILINLYLWTLIAVWDAPFRRLLKLSIQLVFAQPLWTAAIFIGCLVVVIASIILPIAFVIAVSGAIIGYIAGRGTWIVVTKYVLPSEVPLIDLH